MRHRDKKVVGGVFVRFRAPFMKFDFDDKYFPTRLFF
jgi:hypothetical protein